MVRGNSCFVQVNFCISLFSVKRNKVWIIKIIKGTETFKADECMLVLKYTCKVVNLYSIENTVKLTFGRVAKIQYFTALEASVSQCSQTASLSLVLREAVFRKQK